MLAKDIKRKLFLLREDIVNLNHGSFGTVPKIVAECHYKFILEQESCPEIWFRESYFHYINQSRHLIANLIKAHTDDVVLVENASYAVNSILRTFPFKFGDKILLFSSAYKMVFNTLNFLSQTLGVHIVVVPIKYPVLNSVQLEDSLSAKLKNTGPVKLCIFSHISSMPSMIEPVQRLTRIAKSYGCQVMIDGAHAPGVIDINVNNIDADYYIGNCHKWLYSPKGSAFLWVAPSQQQPNFPQPVVISSSGKNDFIGRFEYTGTRDYTAFATIPSALSFIEDVLGGADYVKQYCHDLVMKASRLLIKEWNTKLLVGEEDEELIGFMSCVVLPCNDPQVLESMQKYLWEAYKISYVYSYVDNNSGDYADSMTIGDDNFSNNNNSDAGDVQSPCIEITNGIVGHRGSNDHISTTERIFFVRISSQIYLDISDFELFATCVKDYLKCSH